MDAPQTDVQVLLARLEEFVAFARRRLGDPELAADAVQEALSKALTRIHQLENEDRLVAWYYRILRNVITDLGQRRARQPLPMEGIAELSTTTAEHSATCACIADLLDRLPDPYARALRLVEFDGASLEAAAAAEGISVTNLKQRRFRARSQLRELLEATCRVCATHGCLDCTCARSGTSGGGAGCHG